MRGVVFLPPPLKRRVREMATAAWPLEACGLLEGNAHGTVVHLRRALACANLDPDPEHRYRIDPETYLRAEHAARAIGRMIVGVWHSHPHGGAAPSATDAAESWPGWSYLIAGVTNEGMIALRCWRMLDDEPFEQPIRAAGEPR